MMRCGPYPMQVTWQSKPRPSNLCSKQVSVASKVRALSRLVHDQFERRLGKLLLPHDLHVQHHLQAQLRLVASSCRVQRPLQDDVSCAWKRPAAVTALSHLVRLHRMMLGFSAVVCSAFSSSGSQQKCPRALWLMSL